VTNRGGLTKGLAIAGTSLVWLPMAVALVIGVIGTIEARRPRFDYLIPGELGPVELVGALLLLWAALRARANWRAVLGWLVAAVAFVVGSQAVALATGLATGAIEPEGWPMAVVNALFAAYWVALIALGVTGIRLVSRLFADG